MTETTRYIGGAAARRQRLQEQARDALKRADLLTAEARQVRREGDERAAELLADRSQYWRGRARELRRELEEACPC